MREIFTKPLPKMATVGVLIALLLSTAGLGAYQYFTAKEIDKMEQETGGFIEEEIVLEDKKEEERLVQNTAKFGTAACPTTLTESEINAEIAGWKKVENTKYKFSYYVPKDFVEYEPPEAEGAPEEVWFKDADFDQGFMNMEYTVDWKAGGVYEAYKEVGKATLQVACTNATLFTKKIDSEGLYLLEADFYPNGNHHRIFYFYKSLGGASLDSDFGEQFKLILKTIQFN